MRYPTKFSKVVIGAVKARRKPLGLYWYKVSASRIEDSLNREFGKQEYEDDWRMGGKYRLRRRR